jgi:hypothetical protein
VALHIFAAAQPSLSRPRKTPASFERESLKRLKSGRAAPWRTQVTDGWAMGVRSRLGKPKGCAYAPAMKG